MFAHGIAQVVQEPGFISVINCENAMMLSSVLNYEQAHIVGNTQFFQRQVLRYRKIFAVATSLRELVWRFPIVSALANITLSVPQLVHVLKRFHEAFPCAVLAHVAPCLSRRNFIFRV